MIFYLINWFQTSLGIKFPVAFQNYSTRMTLAAMTALLITIFLGPWFIKKVYRIKNEQSELTEYCPQLAELHAKKKETPTMGGALILIAMLISLFLWMDLRSIFTLIFFITTVTLGLLGARDDYLKMKYKNSKGLNRKQKLCIQGMIGLLLAIYLLVPAANQGIAQGEWFHPPVIKEVVKASTEEPKVHGATSLTQVPLQEFASRIYIPFFKEPIHLLTGGLLLLAGAFIIFVVVGTSNSVNLTDGLDGLAAGCLILVASCLTLFAFLSNHVQLASYLNIAYIEGSGEIAIYLSAFVGACIGFLWYNGYPAQVFMGDTGSLALGGIIGVAAVLLKRELLLGIIGGVFVMETVSVILQIWSFQTRQKRIFLCTPIHHHFEYKGWPETKVVIRFWIIGLLLALVGLASLKFQ